MIQKLLNKLKNKVKINLNPILSDLERISKISEELVIYGSPTEGSWLGIANATRGLFSDNSLEIPQWYSHCKLSIKQQHHLIEKIRGLKFSKVIISGFADYFFSWIDQLNKDCDIEILYHGTISEWHEPIQQKFIQKLILCGQTEKIKRMGFVKKGLEAVFQKLYNIDCFHLPLTKPIIPPTIQKLDIDRSKIHIGVFGADTFNKNLHNQVVHSLLIENAIVHVLDKSVFAYLGMNDRIVEHGKNLPREKFLGILGSMDLNLYISFNESWGQIKNESAALGVRCLDGFSFDYISEIEKGLSV